MIVSFNAIAALICAQSLEVVGYVALSVCFERCGKKLKRLADQPNFAQKAKQNHTTSNNMSDATSTDDAHLATKTWRILVGDAATGKSRYAAKYVADQEHSTQVLRVRHDNAWHILSAVSLDVQEVLLVTKSALVATILATILGWGRDLDVNLEVWAFSHRGKVQSFLADFEDLEVKKLFILGVAHNSDDDTLQEVLL